MSRDLNALIQEMTLEEKAGMCSGLDFWHLKGVERLGIPSIMVSDGPHGLRKQDDKADHLGINDSIKAVCFPPAALSACSFDRDLMKTVGEAIGTEAQAEHLGVVLGPAVNIKRSPLCGRNFEYYSEDPYLAGEVAASFIEGVQSKKVGTSIKHFAANNQEFNRMSASSEVDERTMREIYLPAFETAVKKAQPYTVMCSYNRLNGTYASEHPWLLTEVLRNEWGFEGFVMSDWGAVNDRIAGVKAGMDLEMPSSGGVNDAKIVAAIRDGSLDEAVLNQTVERILRIIFEFEDNRQTAVFDHEQDHRLAAEVAKESMVLLKNDDRVLPLSEHESVAIIGGFAKHPRYQGGGSSHVNSFFVPSALETLPEGASYVYAEGFSSEQDVYDEALAKEALEAAKNADKAVVFAGLPESFESEGYDRTHMQLPNCQNRLIREILEVQKNVIVVLHNGSAVEMPWLSDVKGLLESYLGGEAGAEAVTAILYGSVNPSGKLAETMPLKLSDNPSYLNFGDSEEVHYSEGVFVGYRYYDAKEMKVAFPFGHGLSYTTFAYSNLKLSQATVNAQDELTVTVDITNTGTTAGKEIVQLYVSDQTGTVRRPLKELKGFEKVALSAGETKTVTFTLNPRSFAFYSIDLHDWYVPAGQYRILVGASSQDIRLEESLCIENEQKLPLKLHMNSTLGELLSDDRTRAYGLELKHKMDVFFGAPEQAEVKDEAVSDDMGNAIAFSMPVRNLLTFDLITEDELQKTLDELNQL